MSIPITADEVYSFPSQTSQLKQHEIAERRNFGDASQFWTEPHHDGIDYSSGEAMLNSVVYAGASTEHILDQVLEHGADTSSWRESSTSTMDELPEEEELASSALAISTPLHSAIAAENMKMLCILLQRGFDPNARALVTGSLALTAAQFAVIIGHHRALSLLMSQAGTRMDMLTPVFNVHALHFAAAMLRDDVFDVIGVSSHPPTTALGHTTLVVACLPYRFEEVHYSTKILESVHDLRILRRTQFTRLIIKRPESSENGARQPFWWGEGPRCLRDIPAEQDRQRKVCRRLINDSDASQIGHADVHGNTSLHYLAASVYVRESLISWVRSRPQGEHVWQASRNIWGHTPKDLWEEACCVRQNPSVRIASRMAIMNGVATMIGGWDPGMRGRW